MIIDCTSEIRKICLSFTDVELKKTFILCVISQMRNDKVPKENASHVNERYQPVNKPIRVIL